MSDSHHSTCWPLDGGTFEVIGAAPRRGGRFPAAEGGRGLALSRRRRGGLVAVLVAHRSHLPDLAGGRRVEKGETGGGTGMSSLHSLTVPLRIILFTDAEHCSNSPFVRQHSANMSLVRPDRSTDAWVTEGVESSRRVHVWFNRLPSFLAGTILCLKPWLRRGFLFPRLLCSPNTTTSMSEAVWPLLRLSACHSIPICSACYHLSNCPTHI